MNDRLWVESCRGWLDELNCCFFRRAVRETHLIPSPEFSRLRHTRSCGAEARRNRRANPLRYQFSEIKCTGGDGGIRTLGTLIEYGSLAGNWFQPLTHVSAAQCSREAGAISISRRLGKVAWQDFRPRRAPGATDTAGKPRLTRPIRRRFISPAAQPSFRLNFDSPRRRKLAGPCRQDSSRGCRSLPKDGVKG